MSAFLPPVFQRIRQSLFLMAALASLLVSQNDGRAQQAMETSGGTTTLMPDGRQLLVGGQLNGRILSAITIRDARTGVETPLGELRSARALHSATLLSDGNVLILGGVDGTGRAVAAAEIVEASGQAVAKPIQNWQPRAGHSATLVSAGRILIAGGIREGVPADDVEWLDLGAWHASALGILPEGRSRHTAQLLATGDTLLWGGQDVQGAPVEGGVLVNAIGGVVSISAVTADPSFAALADSLPADGARDVSPDLPIALRWTRSAHVLTVNASTIALRGPDGPVAARVVPAERGRLAFVTPVEPLELDTAYAVEVKGIIDATGQSFPATTIAFRTAAADDEAWDPAGSNARPGWRTRRAPSRWERTPLPEAAPGVTAIAGRALRLDGEPLARVTVELAGRTTRTDDSGAFLLEHADLPSSWQELWVDGRSANRRGVTYGTFEIAVRITANRTTRIPYIIWMPAIDTANAVRIPSPTTAITPITSPAIPGLEVRLPAGAVIKDRDGRVVREVSLTAIPVDRPPFPLPAGVDPPVYFTIQPGGAYIEVNGQQTYGHGARVIYPNTQQLAPSTRMEFWHYDPENGRGWYVYGRGTVSADGKQIVPNYGVSIHEFTGAMAGHPSMRPTPDPGQTKDGDPVDLATGLFIMEKTDLVVADTLPIRISRAYRQMDSRVRSFGIGSTHAFDMYVVGTTFPYTYLEVVLQDGTVFRYDRISDGTGFSDAVYEHTATSSGFFKSRIRWNGNGWDLDLRDGTQIVFRDGFGAARPAQTAVKRIRDRFGNTITLDRNADGDLTKITSPNGRWISLTYDTSHRITEVRDNINRVVEYTYDTAGRLWKVTDVRGGVTEYTYDTQDRMRTIKDARGIVYLTNEYDSANRVIRQTQADTTTFEFDYTVDASGRVIEVDVTNPRGHVRHVEFDTSKNLLVDVRAVGRPEQQTFSYEWEPVTNLLLSASDPLGRTTQYVYNGFGNPTSITRLAGTGNAVTELYTYDTTFQQVTGVTDGLGRLTTFEYNAQGALTGVRDPLNRKTSLTRDPAGRLTAIANPLGHLWQFGYDGADLASQTDPLGRTTTTFSDAAGRPIAITNPAGEMTRLAYDAMDQVTTITDALGGTTDFAYDPNGNLLTLTDAKDQTTVYTYNSMDWVETRRDPLLRTESYLYDGDGNVGQVTDRNSQTRTLTYDGLNRLGGIAYPGSSITFTRDAGDRLTQIVDSAAGAITRAYNLHDHLTSETTPEGTVSYTSDVAGRRLTMTVTGQPGVSYSYDAADRLTAIAQGAAVVGFGYDDADRVTSLLLPNGILTNYAYDSGSQLTGIAYQHGATLLGDLQYFYDAAGRRTGVGGTWARTGLPAALTSASYNAGNQITAWDGVPFTYDLNGNLTSDGSRILTWNARDELTDMSGLVSASFAYDGTGRRRSKTVNGITTEFLYDGLNPVQEQAAGVPTANLLTGLNIDEYFLRTDNAGPRTLLTDALGSTVALTDSLGEVQTEYTYEPFGSVTASGTASANTFTFTGREADGTGLSFYRARYYDQRLQRFTAEDPIGVMAGDTNLYAYVGNTPQGAKDPLGLFVVARPTGVPQEIWDRGMRACADEMSGRKGWWRQIFSSCNPLGNFGPLGAFSASEATLLKSLFGQGSRIFDILKRAANGLEKIDIPDGLTRDLLLRYRAEAAKKLAVDQTGHNQARIDLIDLLLESGRF